jgi:sugar phosphate isomerase/epimerase
MATDGLQRRTFIKSVAATAGMAQMGSSALSANAKSPAARSIRIGTHFFSKPSDPEELALFHRKNKYSAAYCPHADLNDKERIADIEKAFARHDVVIAEVGRWVNLMDADPAKRKANLDNVTDGLALAEAVGARCCVDIAGSLNKDVWYGPHPDNLSEAFFDAAVENARKIIDAVKPKRARFGYEMMGWALPDSPDAYLRMIRAVDRPAFAVHLDPCNLVNSPRRFYNNTDLLNECFDKLGPYIASCHAKDLTWDVEMNVHFREVPVGGGSMDYKTYLKRLVQLEHQPPLMLEHCKTDEEYSQGRDHILKVAMANKISVA